jgi:hypothetical protein
LMYLRSWFFKVTANQITRFGRLYSPHNINVYSFVSCISGRQRRYSRRGFKERSLDLCIYNCHLFHSKKTSAPNFKKQDFVN